MALTLGTGRRRHRVAVEVYTREGCHLCEDAERRVDEEARGARVRRVDVDADAALGERYGTRVPVIVVDGREVAEGAVERGTVRTAIRRARRGRWRQWRRA